MRCRRAHRDAWRDALSLEPDLKDSSIGAAVGRQEHGRVIQTSWEVGLQLGGEQSAGRLVDARASALQTASIDDFGCGLGHNSLPLCAAFPGAEIIAIDVAVPMLRYGHARARSLGVSGVIFLQAAAIDLPIEDSSCDLIFTTMVLHETSSQALPRIFS